MAIVIQKTVPLAIVASSLADEILASIFTGISMKGKTGLDEGDEIYEVVDHALGKDGMADDLQKLSKIRLEAKVACDISGSQYDPKLGTTIVPSLAMMRMVIRAFDLVQQKLPEDVFRYKASLWASGQSGRSVIDLRNPQEGNFIPPVMQDRLDENNGQLGLEWTDRLLERISRKKPRWHGHGTYLAPQLRMWRKWEQQQGDSKAHRVDILLTDGAYGDDDDVQEVQAERVQGGKYEGIMLQVGHMITHVPHGCTMYKIPPHLLDSTVRDILMAFVQRVF